jgi:murein DD-endopeptidase MepM/ murein hydrolase activator NlpD
LTSLLVVAALGACARIGPPAPVVQGTSTPPRPVAKAMPSRTAPAGAISQTVPGEIVVKPGESLYLVARRHNVPTRALIDANGLQPPYMLQSGQRLTLPQVSTYQVQPGDTLSGIARRFGLGTNEMVRANAIAPPYHVQVGQLLVLPGGAALPARAPEPGPAPMMAERAPMPAAPPAAVESAPLAGMSPAPAARAREPAPATPTAAVPLAPVQPVNLPLAAGPSAPSSAEPVAVAPRSAPPAEQPDDPPPAKTGRGFLWPVRGTVVSDYGAKPGGLQNDGINIAAPRGTPIRAAEGGTVVYAGNELRGFGNLLLVRHRDGWITAYAHADELLVKRGDEVRRGQVIARVGSSGGVASPQLHFEMRKGARHVNPRDYLAPQTAAL